MPAYKTEAISLKTAPFAEADKMVTLFTKERGKVRAIAKGARKIPSRLCGRVETLTYGDYFIAKGRSLDIISQCQVIETFQGIRDQESPLLSALFIIKLVNSGTVDGQRHPELFDLTLRFLHRLKTGENPRLVAKQFVKEFVLLEGIFQAGVNPTDSLSDHVGRDLRVW